MFGRGVAAGSTSLTAAQMETILGTGTTLDGTLPAVYASPVFHRNMNGNKLKRLTVTNRKAWRDIAVLFLEVRSWWGNSRWKYRYIIITEKSRGFTANFG